MSSVLLAIKGTGEIIGALDPDNYTGAGDPHPHGWKELLEEQYDFDVTDLDCICEEQKDAILRFYSPKVNGDLFIRKECVAVAYIDGEEGYTISLEEGERIELDPNYKFGLRGGHPYEVMCHVAEPNNLSYLIPLYALEADDRKVAGRPFAIPAKISVNSSGVSQEFESLSWFEQASDEEILDLANHGFKDKNDELMEFFKENDSQVYLVLGHALARGYSWKIKVDEEAAVFWVEHERPRLTQAAAWPF